VNDNFNNLHSRNLSHIDTRIGLDKILEKYLPLGYDKDAAINAKMAKKLDQRVADIFSGTVLPLPLDFSSWMCF